MKTSLLIGLMSMLLFSGCGYKEGIATSERVSYLYFSGDTTGLVVSIDGGEKISVKPGRDNQYKISPGKHKVQVFENGALKVDRDIYVSDGVAKEIGVN